MSLATVFTDSAAAATEAAAKCLRVLINPTPGAFSLEPSILRALWERAPHYFDTSLSCAALSQPGRNEPLEKLYPGCLVVGDQAHFLQSRSNELRCDPWLLAQFDKLGTALAGPLCRALKTVSVPRDVQWHIFECDDGSEAIHEDHRVWT